MAASFCPEQKSWSWSAVRLHSGPSGIIVHLNLLEQAREFCHLRMAFMIVSA